MGISTVEERDAYNVKCYQRLQQTHMSKFDLSKTNNCDICGFEPYTKNKYREKQDHLTKQHFRERIERLLPLISPYICPDNECQYVGKDKQDIQRHYTGKHNILKMWVDEFLREQAEAQYLPPLVTRGGLNTGLGTKRLRPGPELTFRQMEQIAIQQQQDEEDDIIEVEEEELPLASIKTEVDLSQSCLTISKISRASRVPDKVMETPPSISLIRINKDASSVATSVSSTTASLLLQTVAARAAASKPEPTNLNEDDCEMTMMASRASPSKPTLSFKHPCPQCDMSFPTESARILHQEVCQHPQKVTFLSPPSPLNDDDVIQEPVRKKKRPPPPLIPL